jgi:hypothetical protein
VSVTEFLELAAGELLVIDGTEWRVEYREPQYGRVVLTSQAGERLPATFRMLANHPDCRRSTLTAGTPVSGRGRQPKTTSDLEPERLKLMRIRRAHLLEVATDHLGVDRNS